MNALFKISSRALLTTLLVVFANTTLAGDWPMWRANPGHTAAVTDPLGQTLHLSWTRHLAAPRPAWPKSQHKLQFDGSYEPVVAGKRMFVGSMVDDSLAAYSTTDGTEIWRFFTNGPIRFAPVVDTQRVYVVSDDGYLYCLNAADGALIWKFNGGPSERSIIGNHRLISSWPIRGGVVVSDGVAYFTAGIWPSMGIFVHAVNAETGKSIWNNSETGAQFTIHPHGASSFGSVVPQGYLGLVGDSLIVPGGRSLPAIFDRRTGKVKHFDFGGKSNGGFDVIANEKVYTVRNDLFRLADGARIARVNATVLADDVLIGSSGNEGPIHIQSWDGEAKEVTFKDRRGRQKKRIDFTPVRQWTVQTTSSKPLHIHLKAGTTVYASSGKEILAYELNTSEQQTTPLEPAWSTTIDEDVWSMLAADERLFVVTETGTIHCFSETTESPLVHQIPAWLSVDFGDDWSNRAASLLKLEGTGEGYAIALGIGSGRLIEEIVRRSKLHIVVIDSEQKRVESFRRRLHELGLYGTRVVVHTGDILSFPFPPYLANLIFSEDPASARFDLSNESLKKVFHPLRPYGGVVALPIDKSDHLALSKTVTAARLAGGDVSRHGDYSLITRRGALPGSGSWTHQYGDATNSVVSKDQLVKAPFGVLWFGGPSHDKVLPRHGHGPSPQVAGGRLFIEGPNMLRAVDVYTGRLLWETELTDVGKYYDITSHFPGAGEIGSNYVSLPDRVYVVYGGKILELDSANGELTKEFELPAGSAGKRPNFGFAAANENLLLATSSPVEVVKSEEKSKQQANISTLPASMKPLIKPNAQWQYLAGSDPVGNWTAVDYAAENWKRGEAGFGFSDGDDNTIFRDMRGKYERVYIRKTFESRDLAKAKSLALMINYDDAFIAYLNGTEVIRDQVEKGAGAEARGIGSHEAKGHVPFEIKDFRKHLRAGTNVIAIEGHNENIGSGDFSLDPYLLFGSGEFPSISTRKKEEQPSALRNLLKEVRYSSASRRIIVYDRHSGEQLWSRDAEYNFRHNCIVLTDDTLFCIDGMSPIKLQSLKRRGIDGSGKARLLALDARTGEEKWIATEDVFGTFLNYSAEHDVLIQAGSAYRDRARDEARTGMIAYRGSNGSEIWRDLKLSYGGPCLLWRDKIITNGAGGFQLELLTGKKTGWTYSRMYGCNTAVGSEHLLTFRSGAAGFCDLAGDSGTGNFGGFRSSCTANLIAADGVLNAPDYTRTCSCAYQNQTSLALIHMPDEELWTFNSARNNNGEPLRLGVNLGAPGDRRSKEGVLWFEYPSVGGPSPALHVEISPQSPEWFSRHSSTVSSDGNGLNWVSASGVSGIESVTLKLANTESKPDAYTVRLHFVEPDEVKPGERVFSVALQGEKVLTDFDILKTAGGRNKPVVREFSGVRIVSALELTLGASDSQDGKPPILCGIEVIAEDK